MIDMRIKGATNPEVAKEFGVSTQTVIRTLSWAKKAELMVEAEDKILSELVPAAHKALIRALEGEDSEVASDRALEIFKAVLPSFQKKGANPSGGSSESNSDLATHIAQLRERAALRDNTTDGELVEPDALVGRTPALLPPAEAPVSPQGLPSAAEGHGSAAE